MTLHLDRFDVLGCDLRGGDVADRFNCFRATDKPESMSQCDFNSLTKVMAATWKLTE